MRFGYWAIAATLIVSACDRADMNICRRIPSAEEISVEAYEHPSRHAIAAEVARHTIGSEPGAQKDAARAVRRSTILACLRRHAYLLTKSGASIADVVNAAVTNCDDLIAAEAKYYLRPHRPITDEAVRIADDSYRHEAENMVLEAKAGHCWAQPD
jgi:hypothetical protein